MRPINPQLSPPPQPSMLTFNVVLRGRATTMQRPSRIMVPLTLGSGSAINVSSMVGGPAPTRLPAATTFIQTVQGSNSQQYIRAPLRISNLGAVAGQRVQYVRYRPPMISNVALHTTGVIVLSNANIITAPVSYQLTQTVSSPSVIASQLSGMQEMVKAAEMAKSVSTSSTSLLLPPLKVENVIKSEQSEMRSINSFEVKPFQEVKYSFKSDTNDLLINPLDTLASAAELESERASMNAVPQMMTGANGVALQNTTVSVVYPPKIEDLDDKKDGEWMDVCFTKGNNYVVKHYYNVSEKLTTLKPDTDVGKDLEFIKKKIDLQPGYAYKFRVAAVNACGRGPWSEVAAFKTCLPGFPGTPCAIKISKAVDGACIAWEPPQNSLGQIVEYSVYLAVRHQSNSRQFEPKQNQGGLSFVRVYCGFSNNCTIPNASLALAQVDTTTKPAIIFRIAAKNEKGYGPATQVRWLQESAFPTFNLPKPVAKRGSVEKAQGSAKKMKNEK